MLKLRKNNREVCNVDSRIKELRVKKHKSQDQFGREMGISQQLVSRIELDVQKLPVDLLVKMATYFRVTTDYLLGLSENKYNESIIAANLKLMDEYIELIDEYRQLPRREQHLVIGLMRNMNESSEEEIEPD